MTLYRCEVESLMLPVLNRFYVICNKSEYQEIETDNKDCYEKFIPFCCPIAFIHDLICLPCVCKWIRTTRKLLVVTPEHK